MHCFSQNIESKRIKYALTMPILPFTISPSHRNNKRRTDQEHKDWKEWNETTDDLVNYIESPKVSTKILPEIMNIFWKFKGKMFKSVVLLYNSSRKWNST